MIVLIVYDNRGRAMDPLAKAIAEGAASVASTEVWLRRVEESKGEEVAQADALILGSPNWSGVTSKLKDWMDANEAFWEESQLVGKVGAAFTSGRSRSAGNEITLLQIMHLMVANGMIHVGLPWDDKLRNSSTSYYGVVSSGVPSEDDLELARALGQRVAEVARRLNIRELGPL